MPARRVYMFASAMLWGAFAADQPLFDDADSDARQERANAAYGAGSIDLYLWLLDEYYAFNEAEGVDVEEFETAVDTLAARWRDLLVPAAETAHGMFPPVDAVMWRHYLFCRALLRVSTAFSRLAAHPVMQAGGFADRSPARLAELDALAGLLGKEAPPLGVPGMRAAINAYMEAQASRAAAVWWRLIFDSAGVEEESLGLGSPL